jgi:hypothetical protein
VREDHPTISALEILLMDESDGPELQIFRPLVRPAIVYELTSPETMWLMALS